MTSDPWFRSRKVKTERLRQGLTIEQLSAKSGISASQISNIERELFQPQPRTGHALADAFGLPIEDFMTEEVRDDTDRRAS